MSNTIDTMIDPNDAVLLLIDHQSEILQAIDDYQNGRMGHIHA